MIDFLNWNYLTTPFDPEPQRTDKVIAYPQKRNQSNQSRYSSIDLMRSVARWENEGGAVPQKMQPLLS